MIVSGNQQVSDLLKRGERLIAVGALDSYAADLKTAGHPIKTLYPSDGVFVIPSPTAVVKGSPDPAAAKLAARRSCPIVQRPETSRLASESRAPTPTDIVSARGQYSSSELRPCARR